MPTTTVGGTTVKKLATYALIALVVWWAVKDPAVAAHLVHGISGAFSTAATSVSTIVSGI
jgi:hypothetical protein